MLFVPYKSLQQFASDLYEDGHGRNQVHPHQPSLITTASRAIGRTLIRLGNRLDGVEQREPGRQTAPTV